MRIAFIGQKGMPTRNGGVEVYAENLALNLVKREDEVLAYSRPYYSGNLKEYKGVRIIAVPGWRKGFQPLPTVSACLDLAFRKVDVINVQAIGSGSLDLVV